MIYRDERYEVFLCYIVLKMTAVNGGKKRMPDHGRSAIGVCRYVEKMHLERRAQLNLLEIM